MDFFYAIVRFFVSGGAFMYPILIVFAVGVAIAAGERKDRSYADDQLGRRTLCELCSTGLFQ